MGTHNITVYSHHHFDHFCEHNGINDENVTTQFKNTAFISIVNTPGNMKVWDDSDDREHWFKENHDNVLNLTFDDTPVDMFYKGTWWIAISPEEASETVKFIEDNLGKDFHIHCLAGQSRSQAVAHFILETYPEYYHEIINKTDTPNRGTLRELKTAYNRLHGIDSQKDYEKIFS